MSQYLDPAYAALAPYTPGEQPREKRLVKLNTNELPYPPSDKVIAAAAGAARRLNRYNDPTNRVVLEPLAARFGVGLENVFAGNGSDEVLALAFQGLCPNGVAFADLTYGFYPVYAQLYGHNALVLPLREDFTLDPAGYYGLGRAIFIANPNAPTGLALGLDAIEEIVKRNADSVVVIDEAYVDFGWQSAAGLTAQYDNLLVVGTFSKASGLAGARLGYAVGSKGLIEDLNRLKYSLNPYNVNSMTAAAGAAALEDEAYYIRQREKVAATRARVLKELRGMGFEATDSVTNFLFCRHPRIAGGLLYSGLREMGVLVRRWDTPRIADWLRITVGTDAEMNALLDALRELCTEAWA